ncbi:osmotically inducible protein OsmC [Primorskyibacter sedentarius]|uniref:Osmotically inducible protein OsmC n=1 Tax=Primorskyibacter sedentarius TaxID=745311 RepID=A0A4R3JL18_9RHOB|nr:OsmC family protein [Primorskyibacter sedentarius]TCS66973.1 osmotically inducible protein OsmC [Primorskyibacter sedentarius]
MINKQGSAKWTGDLKSGKGHVSTESGALADQPYGFNTRFEGQAGTNPEELLGAAHASCFSMALSLVLADYGATADEINTTATVSLDKEGDGFAVKKVHLDLSARIPDLDEAAFQTAANAAKEGCPVSKLFKGAEITLDAKLL